MEPKVTNSRIQQLVQSQPLQAPGSPASRATGPSFANILQDRLKVSGHAQTRLESRNIELNRDDWERVLAGIERAEGKGAKESLVMLDEVALVVSIKNRTVITAVDKAHLKDQVFTNIDSAVIV